MAAEIVICLWDRKPADLELGNDVLLSKDSGTLQVLLNCLNNSASIFTFEVQNDGLVKAFANELLNELDNLSYLGGSPCDRGLDEIWSNKEDSICF